MLHRFNPIGRFSRPAMKHRPGGFTLYRQLCGRDVIHAYVAGLVTIYGIPEKWPPGGVFSDKYWQVSNEVVALHKAEKEPIPPEPEEN